MEYVNGFFGGKSMGFRAAAKNSAYLKELLTRSKDAGVVNHLLMVDDEGPLAAANRNARIAAIESHLKWIEAAKVLGCRTVRVNLHGEGSADEKKAASVDSLGRLGEFARPMKINVVVENHGGVTSNGAWLADVVGSSPARTSASSTRAIRSPKTKASARPRPCWRSTCNRGCEGVPGWTPGRRQPPVVGLDDRRLSPPGHLIPVIEDPPSLFIFF